MLDPTDGFVWTYQEWPEATPQCTSTSLGAITQMVEEIAEAAQVSWGTYVVAFHPFHAFGADRLPAQGDREVLSRDGLRRAEQRGALGERLDPARVDDLARRLGSAVTDRVDDA